METNAMFRQTKSILPGFKLFALGLTTVIRTNQHVTDNYSTLKRKEQFKSFSQRKRCFCALALSTA